MTRHRSALAAALGLAAATLALPAAAGSYKVLYSFCAQAHCTDGKGPNGLIEDKKGNLYGTVYQGGAKGFGGIFELKHGAAGRYRYKLLYSFCAEQNCVDGGYPTGGLIIDTKGNLYGTALIGGSQGNGEVFELKRAKQKHAPAGWSIAVLYGFCPQANNCTDGVGPDSGLAYAGAQSGAPYDGTSPLFGTTDGGGVVNVWQGVAYEIQPLNGGWNFNVIYSFCAQANCADGAYPFATLVEDSSGNLYGTALEGGNSSGSGTAFELSPANGGWSESVLYTFCGLANCTDGASPHGGLVLDSAGNLDGTTLEGGASCSIDPAGCGATFTLAPNGNAWQESVTHTFCARGACGNGANPQGEPAATNRDLFAIAEDGGDTRHLTGGGGTLYEMSKSGFKLLHRFCARTDCTDGASPLDGPLRDSAGDLLGTASAGGEHAGGVVYGYAP
ncbi:MAG: choice-of-anchor tandem repeat GloVer-containing protein [Rhizomicrobium sp.]